MVYPECRLHQPILYFQLRLCFRFELALQQNVIMDVFFNDWDVLGEDDTTFGSKSDSHLKVPNYILTYVRCTVVNVNKTCANDTWSCQANESPIENHTLLCHCAFAFLV